MKDEDSAIGKPVEYDMWKYFSTRDEIHIDTYAFLSGQVCELTAIVKYKFESTIKVFFRGPREVPYAHWGIPYSLRFYPEEITPSKLLMMKSPHFIFGVTPDGYVYVRSDHRFRKGHHTALEVEYLDNDAGTVVSLGYVDLRSRHSLFLRRKYCYPRRYYVFMAAQKELLLHRGAWCYSCACDGLDPKPHR